MRRAKPPSSSAWYRLQTLALHLRHRRQEAPRARPRAGGPTLLLLDEVLAGLNPTEVEHMIGIIRPIRERGVTMIIENSTQAIMSFSDRIVVRPATREKLCRGFAGGGRAKPAGD